MTIDQKCISTFFSWRPGIGIYVTQRHCVFKLLNHDLPSLSPVSMPLSKIISRTNKNWAHFYFQKSRKFGSIFFTNKLKNQNFALFGGAVFNYRALCRLIHLIPGLRSGENLDFLPFARLKKYLKSPNLTNKRLF